MKTFSSIAGILFSMLTLGCSVDTSDLRTLGQDDQTSEDSEGAALAGSTRSLGSVQSKIKANLSSLKAKALANAEAKGISPDTCPEGLDKNCSDALFLALVNTRVIKSIALKAQTTVSSNVKKSTASLYVGKASQPAIGAGFKITTSEFKGQPKSTSNPWEAAIGELFLTNAQSLSAGVGAYAFLTDKTSAIGLAGGYAGASPEGWAEGAVYCYLIVSNGTPTGLCDAVQTTGGW